MIRIRIILSSVPSKPLAPASKPTASKTRIQQAQQWLLDLQPQSTEETGFPTPFRFSSWRFLIQSLRLLSTALLKMQNEDGGWSQLPEMNSDAYATGTVLVALLRSDLVSADQLAVKRGIQYLLNTQQPDGSWHVPTRAKPFQTYFETGYSAWEGSIHFSHRRQLGHGGTVVSTADREITHVFLTISKIIKNFQIDFAFWSRSVINRARLISTWPIEVKAVSPQHKDYS